VSSCVQLVLHTEVVSRFGNAESNSLYNDIAFILASLLAMA